jgi:DNA invertase Pin-like site-specific DNA recombinase
MGLHLVATHQIWQTRKVADADHIATAKRMKADGHTVKDIAKYLGVSRATLYRYLQGAMSSAAEHSWAKPDTPYPVVR